jgi:hypothetical protein
VLSKSEKYLANSVSESTNLESPVKSRRGVSQVKDLGAQKGESNQPLSKDRPSHVRKAVAEVPSVATSIVKSIEILPQPVEEPPPETPAGLDLFSPLSSQPSTDRRGLRDTPPPPELDPTTSTGDTLTGAGRGGRRARGNVSYAEPNLRDKMRRPTKDLVDAVTGEGRNRKSTSIKPEAARSDSEGPAGSDTMRTVIIRKDDTAESSWKHLPSLETREQEYRAGATSPLTGKTASEEDQRLPLTITTDRRRRQSALSRDDAVLKSAEIQPASASASASAVTISTLIASSKRAKENERRKQQSIDQALQDLNIYDFEATSSPPAVEQKRFSKEELTRKREERRRNSLVAASSMKATGMEKGSPETDSEISASEGAGRTRIRRQTLGGAGGKKPDLQAPTEAAAPAGEKTDAADNGSRAASSSRRRSMMI